MSKVENAFLRQELQEIAVANVYLYDSTTGIEYGTTTLETHELTQKTNTETVYGGTNTDTITVLDKNKEFTIKITDPVARQDIAMLRMGSAIKDVGTDQIPVYAMPKNYTVTTDASNLIVTLDETPLAGEIVAVYNNKTGKMIDPTKAVLATNKITITEAGIVAGDTVYITGYKYSAKTTDKYAEIRTSSATPTVTAVIDLPLFNGDGEVVYYKQYIFPKAKIDGSVTLTGKTERTKATDTTTLTVLKDNTLDYIGRVIWKEVTV